MKFWVTLEGRDAEVEFHAEGKKVWIEVEGKRLEADFHELPDGEVYSLLVDGASHEVRVSPGQEGLAVTVEGTALEVEVRHPIEKVLKSLSHASGPSRGETITAPMPGVVVSILVKPGDTVAHGQAVAVIEAMKMQNELIARAGGVVSEVLVAERVSVAAGQALVRLKGAA